MVQPLRVEGGGRLVRGDGQGSDDGEFAVLGLGLCEFVEELAGRGHPGAEGAEGRAPAGLGAGGEDGLDLATVAEGAGQEFIPADSWQHLARARGITAIII